MMLARFADEESLAAALGELRAARLGPLETYTPAPLAGVEGASPVPLIVLIAGLFVFGGGHNGGPSAPGGEGNPMQTNQGR